jgi:serine/threonine protein kinase
LYLISINDEQQKLKDRIFQLTNTQVQGKIEIVTIVSDFMSLNRGQVYQVGSKNFLIRGDMYESRFGITDQPKFWVKRAIDLATGKSKIIKFIFYEEFIAQIGPLRIRCYRNPEKESDVLSLVQGDSRFMQETTMKDEGGNSVRMIDFIKGQSLYAYVIECKLSHEEYYITLVPSILRNLIKCFEGIKLLHENNFCHGDIRSDHIFMERESGAFRWIDFDLKQNYLDFDLWTLGNVLNFVLGKGIRSFHAAYNSNLYSQTVTESLNSNDASAFYNY